MPDGAPAHRDLEWNDLSLILAICRAESLSGAARLLGQTHSTVFRRINAIEEKTGVRFFERFRHGYVMTEAGRAAMAAGERVEKEFDALGRAVIGRDEKLEGPIRVTCPESFAEEHAPGIVARFCAGNPGITIELAPGHGALDLNRREAEVAIRATKAPPGTSWGRKICDFRLSAYASPGYVKGREGLAVENHRFVVIEGTAPWFVPTLWESAEAAARQIVFSCRASRAVQQAAAEGLGIAPLPAYVGDADPRLVRVADTFPSLDMALWVLTHPDLRTTARVRAFMAHLYDELGRLAPLFEGRQGRPGARRLIGP